MNWEENLRQQAAKLKLEAIEQVRTTARAQEQRIYDWYDDVVNGVDVKIPDNLKTVLDRGGSIRQYRVDSDSMLRLESTYNASEGVNERLSELVGAKRGDAVPVRLTVIVEPLDSEALV
jgi:hypothetical protein